MPGDLIVVQKKPALVPERGDIVVFGLPRDPGIEYLKRVIGLPGDRVRMRAGALLLNGRPVERTRGEPVVLDGETLDGYLETLPGGRSYVIARHGSFGPLDDTEEFRVPAGRFFALGDNRDNSLDSRVLNAVGYVPLANIAGRLGLVIWAQDRSRILTRPR